MRRSRRTLAFSAIAVFVVVDAILILAAFANVQNRPSASTGASNPQPTSAAKDAPQDSDGAGTTADALAADGNRVARYTVGRCAERGTSGLMLSSNGGDSFDEIALPLEDDENDNGRREIAVTSILAVDLSENDAISVIGTDIDCDVHGYTTSDGGDTWQTARPSGWFVNGTSVRTPGGPADPGCSARSVWSLSDAHAKVLCTGGTIVGTDDGGTEWVRLGALDNLTAGSFSGLRNGVAAAKSDECSAQAYTTDDAGGSWEVVGCIDSEHATTSLVATGDRTYALVDGTVMHSPNRGQTWEKP